MLAEAPPVRITQKLWMLGTAAYPIYLFVADGEAAILEGGVGAIAPLVIDQMDRVVGVVRDSVKLLVITHAHPDHVMAVPRLRALLPNVSVVASEKAAQTLATEKAVGFFCQVDDVLAASLKKMNVVPADQSLPPLAEMRIAVDRTVKEGDSLPVGSSVFQVLETPGHSDCSISLYEPQEKILVLSDVTGYYMPADNSWWPNYFTGYGVNVRSIERLAELDAEVLCLSHNAAIRGAAEARSYLQGALSATRQYHERIIAEAKSGKSVREIAEQLGAEIHQKTQLMPLDFFQKNCGLLVKQSLKHEGLSAQ